MTKIFRMLATAGISLLALGVCTPWAMAQSKDAAPAAAQQGQDSAKKSAKDIEKTKALAIQKQRERAERRYREGLAHEKAGSEKDALIAFLEAGEAGHGLAQKKLSEIYDRGNSATKRDYETSVIWYDRARAQGVQFTKPLAPIRGR